jgi:hypothetical protein
MKKLFFSILAPAMLLSASYSQEVKVSAFFDTSRIYLGDQTRFTITVDQPADMTLILPEFKDTLIQNIEVLAGPLTDSIRNINGILRVKKEYLITSFDSGLYQIPPVYAELRNEEGLKRFYSDYAFLEVMRIRIAPPDTTARIFDIIGPYKAPLTLGEILPWILLLLIAAVLVYFAIRFFRRLRRHDSVEEVLVIPDPAHIIAFRDLEILKAEKLWQKGEIKKYYTRLTEILRQYLENRFSVCSLELTTSETLEALIVTGFRKNADYDKLKAVLTGADMVKFAKYNPEPVENESFFQDAWDFISETRVTDAPADNGKIKTESEEGKS